MVQTFDLKNMGFAEMQHEELEAVDGGGLLDAISAVAGVTGCVALVISTPVTGPIGPWLAVQVAAATISTGISIAGMIPEK
jgi:hypothetical protein